MNCYYCGRKYSYSHERKCKYGKISRTALFEYCVELATTIRMPIRFEDGKVWYDGHTVPFPTQPSSINYYTLHEIAHWIYSSPEERKDPGFGMGPDDQNEDRKVIKIQELLSNQVSLDSLMEFVHSL